VRISLTYKHIVRSSPIRCGTLNTHTHTHTHTLHDQHYWAWFVDINGGWPDSRNLIAGGPMDDRSFASFCMEIRLVDNLGI